MSIPFAESFAVYMFVFIPYNLYTKWEEGKFLHDNHKFTSIILIAHKCSMSDLIILRNAFSLR